ncbi:elongation factor G2-like protein [Trypanosoma conorhini]|uniref:Elongation factor G2-like protein n=1 Tax=Trypanosoma conorhini TaxID=83891 RepID=A0A422PSC6_9TRYP|nr:elongation factor G2-like protein [Trypanosoma conorhini]RNF20646.1 elongation factor G2-like protein [Trypanosoma conorhini]
MPRFFHRSSGSSNRASEEGDDARVFPFTLFFAFFFLLRIAELKAAYFRPFSFRSQNSRMFWPCAGCHWRRVAPLWRCTTAGQLRRPLSQCVPLNSARAAASSSRLTAAALESSILRMRNIGVVAHIDAGKTTTTERMLFYAGVLKRVGDVDSGTTTTDFMKEEMERGITIQSAAVSFQWRNHSIHLIDTPGHVDFTVEVERAMRVVDGVVALFDASAGVQAQSYTVLRQSRRFGIPVIGFLNKMDKYNADFKMSVESIRRKLEVEPLLLQLPLLSEDGSFEGVIDVVEMKACRFGGNHGLEVARQELQSPDFEPAHLLQQALAARHELISTLTALDDLLSDAVIALLDQTDGDEQKTEVLLPSDLLRAAIRRQTLRQAGPRPVLPLLCGAARRDQGVQPLLDAVADYLPSPLDRPLTGYARDGDVVPLPPATAAASAPVVALAFKVTHATGPKGRRQPLVFFRVYSGKVTPRLTLVNNNCNRHESLEKLYVMHANRQVEVPHLVAGEIGAAFMQFTKTGATLFAPPQQPQPRADGARKEVFTLEGINPPPAVISFAVEAATKQQIPLLDGALQELSFEDPSLRVHKNDFGQVVLSGMGELHLEIVMSRLEHDYQLKCRLLRAIVEYREVVREAVELLRGTGTYNELPYVECSLRLLPLLEADDTCDPSQTCSFALDEAFTEKYLAGAAAHRNDRRRRAEDHQRGVKDELRLLTDVFSGAVTDCAHMGPLAGLPLHGVRVVLTEFKKFGGAQLLEAPLQQAARSLVLELLRSVPKAKLAAMEPMMEVEVHLSEAAYIGGVVSSLNERKAVTVDIQDDGRSVKAIVPMRNIVRYTMELRRAVKGHANLYTRLHHYRVIEDKAVLSRIMKNLGIYDGH